MNVAQTWTNMAVTTRTGFQGIHDNMKTTLDQIVNNNKEGYQRIQNNTSSTLKTLMNTNKTSYDAIRKNISETLTGIERDNKTKYKSILDTTKSTLHTLQNETNNSMTQVKQSWNSMRNSLIDAASTVRSRTIAEINHLTANIRTFYRRIQNPALLLAGPMPYKYRNRPASSLMGSAGAPRGHFAGPGPSRLTRENIRKLDTHPPVPCSDPDDCLYASGWD
jgi:hypothetical protein